MKYIKETNTWYCIGEFDQCGFHTNEWYIIDNKEVCTECDSFNEGDKDAVVDNTDDSDDGFYTGV